MLSLSQSHLTLLDACPRKYQYVFFDALSGPTTYEQQVTTQWGSQFHLLMQQRALNLPVELLGEADSEMTASLTALAKAAPEVFAYLPVSQAMDASDALRPEFSQSEHRRTLAFNDYLLTVVYDLVVLSFDPAARQGQIFDWKTHQQPPRKVWLQNDWQTRLYLYVLCETTDLSPEQLSMTYWFVRLGNSSTQPKAGDRFSSAEPSSYRFGYSEAQHQQTQRDLQRLTDQLSQMQQRSDFPKVAVEKGLCDRCPFNARCDRVPMGEVRWQNLPTESPDPQQLLQAASQITADTVEEIPL